MPKDEIEILEDIDRDFEATASTLEGVAGERDEDLDSKVVIELQDGGARAYLLLTNPKLGGRPPEIEKVIEQIREEGILEFDRETIRQAIEKKEFNKPILIAMGRPPGMGKRANLIIKTRDWDAVTAGQILAIKEAATRGEEGRDVYGNRIPGLMGDDVELIAGPGVKLVEDGSKAYAEVDGEVIWTGNRVEVKQEEGTTRLSKEEMEEIEETISKMRHIGQDGEAEVALNKDGLEAYLTIFPSRLGGRPLDLKGAMDALTSEGIRDIDQERVRRAIEDEEFNQPILVARGIPPIRGEDAYFTNRVQTGANVNPEQLLVVKVPPTQGRQGRSVKGEIIEGLFGKEITILAGENVQLSSDGLRAYATDYGEVEWEENRVSVRIAATEELDLEDMERELENLEKTIREIKATSSNLDGQAEVILSEDKSEAYIVITRPKIGGEPVQMETILATLREKGIVGVDREAISKAIKEHRFNKKILVARGIPPTKGEDARFIYRFGVDEKGNTLGEKAVPGQLLMVKVDATRGSSGKAVTGGMIPGHLGRPLEIRPGRGVILSDDGTKAYAASSMQIIWEGDRISVEDIKEIDGDLNPEEEDIDFAGIVHIKGAIGDKVMVKAQSDILIQGGVGDVTLISGGNIKIGQAIFGKGEGRITAKGNILAASIEGMMIETEGDLFVDDFIRKCSVSAKRVICGGQIDGGKISANELVEAKSLGSEAKVKTRLKVEKEGKISSSEAVHPGVELVIGQTTLNIKNRKQGLTYKLEESTIKEGPFIKTEVEKGFLAFQEAGCTLEDLTPSVVIDGLSAEEAKREGAKLLGLSPEEVDLREIFRDEEKQPIRIGVFPAGVSGPWDMNGKISKEFDESMVEADTDGYYRLGNLQEGLFLTIFPPKGSGIPVEIGDVRKEIGAKGFKDVDDRLLKAVVAESTATPVKIAPRQHIPDLDGLATVEISEDKRRAELSLIPPQPGGLPASFDDVILALKDKGVVAGIKEDVIKGAIKEGRYGSLIVVAQEIPPVAGESSRIEYHFDLTPPKAKFTEDEWGRVDFKELNIIHGVVAGQVLATKTGSVTPGRPGLRMNGEEIPPPPPEEAKFAAGKNTEISEDGTELRSTIGGHVLFLNERVNVEPLYEVKGDVNMATGNIDYLGTVDVAGSVEDGFKVRAEGNIQIKGGVGKSTLSAGGSVNIGQGIQANHEGKVWAGKDIICKFVQMGDLFAREDIIVDEDVLHSELNAGGSVIVAGKRGLIIGGEIRAKDEVRAKVIGCEMNTPTTIEVGAPPRISEQIKVLRRLLNEDLKEFERLKFNIMGLRHQRKTTGLSPEREELLSQWTNLQNVLAQRLHSYAHRKEMLEKDLLRSTGGVVNVMEAIYPGVVIIIRNAVFEVTERLESVTFCLEGEQIKCRSYGGRAEEGRV